MVQYGLNSYWQDRENVEGGLNPKGAFDIGITNINKTLSSLGYQVTVTKDHKSFYISYTDKNGKTFKSEAIKYEKQDTPY